MPEENNPTEETSPAASGPSEEKESAPEVPSSKEAVGQNEFAKLLESSSQVRKVSPGEVVKGRVLQIGEVDLLIDVGARSEALMARTEMQGDDGSLTVSVGDEVEASVVSVAGGIRISRRAAIASRDKAAVREMLMEAYKSRLPVQGKVTASIKGGYEVKVAGVRGFCPFSQIDVRRQEEPTLYFNKTFDFLIKEYQPRKRNLILSRRAIIEAENRKKETEVRAQMTPGKVFKGTIVSLQDFGAFVDLGSGVQGLLHVSEISHSRVNHPRDVLELGQEMDFQVLRVDKKRGKISLTRKALEEDPWSSVAQRFKEGHILTSKVVRVTEFGAFVELQPGVDGLLHVSEMAALDGASRDKKASDLVKAGEEIKVQVLKVDAKRRRVSLGLAGDDAVPGERVKVAPLRTGQILIGKVERVEKFGVFVRLGPGRTGMIPNSEMGTPRGADHARMFPPGTELRAEIIEADGAGRKIRLSVSKAEGREEREALDRYKKDSTRSGTGSFSTLADAFKAIRREPSGDESSD